MTDSNDLARVQAALAEAFDSGNAMMDAFDDLWSEPGCDMLEFEQALVGIPEVVNGEVRDIKYFMDKLKETFVRYVILELNEQEHHG